MLNAIARAALLLAAEGHEFYARSLRLEQASHQRRADDHGQKAEEAEQVARELRAVLGAAPAAGGVEVLEDDGGGAVDPAFAPAEEAGISRPAVDGTAIAGGGGGVVVNQVFTGENPTLEDVARRREAFAPRQGQSRA